MPTPAQSLSPCIGLCKLDRDDVCQGCHRTMAEIRSWGLLTRGQQRRILTRIHTQQRERASATSVTQANGAAATPYHPD